MKSSFTTADTEITTRFEPQQPLALDAVMIVQDCVVVELKCIEKILPVHEAQIITYLKLSGKRLGLIINFNEKLLKNGIRRIVL